MTIKRINNVDAGVKRPLRVEDIQDVWDGLAETLASGTDVTPIIVSGFKYDENEDEPVFQSGVLAFGGKLYTYDPDKFSPIYAKFEEVETVPIYVHEAESNDLRTFSDSSVHAFSYQRYVSAESTGGTLIGEISRESADRWRLGHVANLSVTLQKLEQALQDKMNLINMPRKILDFSKHPLEAGAVDVPFVGLRTGSLVPVYCDIEALDSPYERKRLTGFMLVSTGDSDDEEMYVYNMYTNENFGSSAKTSVFASRKFGTLGLDPSIWRYVGGARLQLIFKGWVTEQIPKAGKPAKHYTITPTTDVPFSKDDTFMVRWCVHPYSSGATNHVAYIEPFDATYCMRDYQKYVGGVGGPTYCILEKKLTRDFMDNLYNFFMFSAQDVLDNSALLFSVGSNAPVTADEYHLAVTEVWKVTDDLPM